MSDKIMNRLQEHLNEALSVYDKDWFVICLQGSQNYGISDENSDIDSKLMVLPSVEDLVFNKKSISHTHVMENDEHCDIKDVRDYMKIFRKSNINFVEVLFTDWYIANPKYRDIWEDLRAKRELLAHINPYNAVKAMKGMAYEKRHALCHEYPSRMEFIEKYGYDGKQLCHLVRIKNFIHKFVEGESYAKCIDETGNQYLLDMKRHNLGLDLDAAVELSDNTISEIDKIADEFCETHESEVNELADKYLNDALYELITRSMREQLL